MTDGENDHLDAPLVKMTGKRAAGLSVQRSGETGMNMERMLMAYTEAVDESRGCFAPPDSFRAAIDKPIIAAAASPAWGDPVVTGGGYR